MKSEGRKREFARVFDRIFHDREFILRANDRVACLRFRKWMQITACAFLIPIVAWAALSPLGFVLHQKVVAERDRQIESQRLAYFDLLAEVSDYHQQFARIASDLESNQVNLLSLLSHERGQPAAVTAAQDQLRDTVDERDRVVLAREGLRSQLGQFESDLREIAGRNAALQSEVTDMTSALEDTEQERARVVAAREHLDARLSEVQAELGTTRQERSSLEGQVTHLRKQLHRLRQQNSLTTSELDQIDRIAKLEEQLAQALEAGRGLEAKFVEMRLSARSSVEQSLSLTAERDRFHNENASLRNRLSQSENVETQLTREIGDLTGSLDAVKQLSVRLRKERDQLVGSLQARGLALADLTETNSELQSNASRLQSSLDEALARSNRLGAKKAELELQADRLVQQLAGANRSRSELDRQLAALQTAKLAAEHQSKSLLERQDHLENSVIEYRERLARATARQRVRETRISNLTEELAAARGEEDRLKTDKIRLVARVASLERQLGEMQRAQETLVKRLSERTQLSVDTMEKTVSMTGLDVDQLLAQVQTDSSSLGRGGPFIPGEFLGSGINGEKFKSSVALLDLHIGRWEALEQIVRTLPLVAPLEQFRLSSGFGYRKDPLNGRKAVHAGLDFSAPTRTPIFATSSGKVLFAGWRGRYGRTVEIDHGLGVRSRYAHLKKILVKPGQEVDHRQKIGLVGSSGRSTGPHLHYEVLVNDKPVDPMKFLRAGKHVFKS